MLTPPELRLLAQASGPGRIIDPDELAVLAAAAPLGAVRDRFGESIAAATLIGRLRRRGAWIARPTWPAWRGRGPVARG